MKSIAFLNQDISKLSRRTFLACIPVLTAPSLAQSQSALIKINKLNCFELRVSDVSRSVAFYQALFGMPEQARLGDRICLRVGDGPAFMAIRPLETGESPSITQLGYSLENYDIETQLSILEGQGFQQIEPPAISAPGLDNAKKTWVKLRGNTPELYFADARGLIVQLSDINYCGGSGPLGDSCPIIEEVSPGSFSLTDINHFTVFVNDGAGANAFYQDIFGLSVQAYQGPGSQVTGIGDGYQFVMYPGPFPGGEDAPANMHHACFNMNNFNVEEILSTLSEHGLSPQGENPIGPMMHYVSRRMPARGGAEGGTPEVYFTDPDGILMQLQDASYCGGGGYLGNECIQG